MKLYRVIKTSVDVETALVRAHTKEDALVRLGEYDIVGCIDPVSVDVIYGVIEVEQDSSEEADEESA
jgi:hypothetical protein